MQTLHLKLQIPKGSSIAMLHVSESMQALLNLETSIDLTPATVKIIQVINQDELNHFFPKIFEHLSPTDICWIIYPKKSGKIKTDLTRDHGWEILQEFKYRGIRLISINSDYTAVRVKPFDKVKKQITPSYPEIDLNNRKVTLPDVVVEQLKTTPILISVFNAQSFTFKKEAVLGILSAKKEETRKKRIHQLIDSLNLKM